jgi:hypothetical protein
VHIDKQSPVGVKDGKTTVDPAQAFACAGTRAGSAPETGAVFRSPKAASNKPGALAWRRIESGCEIELRDQSRRRS